MHNRHFLSTGKKLSMLLVMSLLFAGLNLQGFAASNLIFHSGFEPGSTGYPSGANSVALIDITGTDNSLPDHNNWVNDLDNYPDIGSFFIQYESLDNAHQRYANMVDDPTNVLFEDNFEDDYQWVSPSPSPTPHVKTEDKGKRNWSFYYTSNTTMSIQADPVVSTNQAVKVLSTLAGVNYPKLDKQLDLSGNKKVRIAYRVLNNSSNTYVDIQLPSPYPSPYPNATLINIKGSQALLGDGLVYSKAIDPIKWTSVVLDCDFENNLYSATVNGQTLAQGIPMFSSTQSVLTNVKIRFNSGLNQNQYFYLDDVKISKTDMLFSDDFDFNYAAGGQPRLSANDKGSSNWSEMAAEGAALVVQADPGNAANKLLQVSSTKTGANHPQLAKLLDVSSAQRFTVDYKVKNQRCNTALELQLPQVSLAPKRTLVYLAGAAAIAGGASVAINPDEWTSVSITCDLYNNLYSVTVNGSLLAKSLRLFSVTQTDFRNVRIAFASELANGQSYYIDNVTMRNASNRVLKYYAGKVVNDSKLRIQSVVMGNTNAYEYYYKSRVYLNESFEYIKSIGYNLSGYWITLGEFFDGSNWGDNFVYPNYCSRITMGIANPQGAGKPLKFNVNLENSLIDKYDWNYTPVWTYDSNVEVPIGKWATLEVYLKQGIGTDPANGGGQFYMYLTGEDGVRRPVFEIDNTTYNPGAVKNGIEHMQPMKFYTKKSIINDVIAKNTDIQVYWDDFELRTTLPAMGEETPVPQAPDIVANDVGNILVGYDPATMEVALSSDGGLTFGSYTSAVALDLSGDKMAKVRIKAVGGTPAGMDALAVFTASSCVYGDVNDDGAIDISDVVITAEIAVGSATYTADQMIRANVNSKEDQVVDISDVILIAERAVDPTTIFPVDLP